MKRTVIALVPLLVVFAVLLSSNFIDAAWTAPSGLPSAANNAPAPINVSTTNQVKYGDITAVRLKAGTEMWSPRYCDERGRNCVDIANVGNNTNTNTNTNTGPELAFNVHTAAQCASRGGRVTNIGNTYICRFARSSCPSGWRQYQNWSSVNSRSCGSSGCMNTRCSVGHTWQNRGRSCGYITGDSRSSDGCQMNGYRATCSGTIREIGCY